MNFLKTILVKYYLSVNSEKLSKKPLTQGIFYVIIILGGASGCLTFLFFYALLFPLKITATNVYRYKNLPLAFETLLPKGDFFIHYWL